MKRLVLISACVAATSYAFAQGECVKTAVNLSGNQMTLTTSGAKSTTLRDNYVFYERKRHRKNDEVFSVPGSENPSQPLLLSSRQDVTAIPEKYNVSVTLPERNATACADSDMNVAANLDVERVASYTGNFPATKMEPNYMKVTKRQYKMAMRKKRKIERKEEKIARRTQVNVEVKATPSA